MPSRKFHSKTRHGCDTCKRSKVRCDLQRPTCKRCIRLARPCSFADEEDQSSLIVIPSRREKRSEEHGSHKTPGPSNVSSIKDLEFMHHYSTSTCLTMTDDPSIIPIWQHAIPKLAFQNEFLLHGLLSLAALHQRHSVKEDRQQSLVDYAADHQSMALAGYIPQMQKIDEDNCHALFAFSQILPALSFAFLQYPEVQPPSADFVASFTGIFDLLIGATVIAVEGRAWLRAGVLGPAMRHPFTNVNEEASNLDLQISLNTLVQHISISPSQSTTDSDDIQAENNPYMPGMRLLAFLFSPHQNQTMRMARVVGWPVFAGAPYLALLKQHDAKALAILAHYGAALHMNEDIWYLRDLGARLVKAVFELVDVEWHPCLSWPLNCISE